MAEQKERPPLDCGHDHEWVDIPNEGSFYGKKWTDYRVEIEAIVVRSYASADERLHDRQPMYPPVLLNPNNPCQILRIIRWRAYYRNARAYAEAYYHGAASVQGLRLDHPESTPVERAVFKGLNLISIARAKVWSDGLGRPKEPKDYSLAGRVRDAILSRDAKGKPSARRFVARDLALKGPTLARKLREAGAPSFSKIKESLSKKNTVQ